MNRKQKERNHPNINNNPLSGFPDLQNSFMEPPRMQNEKNVNDNNEMEWQIENNNNNNQFSENKKLISNISSDWDNLIWLIFNHICFYSSVKSDGYKQLTLQFILSLKISDDNPYCESYNKLILTFLETVGGKVEDENEFDVKLNTIIGVLQSLIDIFLKCNYVSYYRIIKS